jgi:hypothetical protein
MRQPTTRIFTVQSTLSILNRASSDIFDRYGTCFDFSESKNPKQKTTAIIATRGALQHKEKDDIVSKKYRNERFLSVFIVMPENCGRQRMKGRKLLESDKATKTRHSDAYSPDLYVEADRHDLLIRWSSLCLCPLSISNVGTLVPGPGERAAAAGSDARRLGLKSPVEVFEDIKDIIE